MITSPFCKAQHCGAFELGPAFSHIIPRAPLQALSKSPGARRQILEARIKQDWDLTPQAWNSWWHDLVVRCALLEQPGALGGSETSPAL